MSAHVDFAIFSRDRWGTTTVIMWVLKSLLKSCPCRVLGGKSLESLIQFNQTKEKNASSVDVMQCNVFSHALFFAHKMPYIKSSI